MESEIEWYVAADGCVLERQEFDVPPCPDAEADRGQVESPLSADFRSRRSGRKPDGTSPGQPQSPKTVR